MIIDQHTNKLYLSSLLKDKHIRFYNNFTKKLTELGVEINYLNNTKDIWCRDYMPIQRNNHVFIQFKFNPNYLNSKKYDVIRTNPREVWMNMKIRVKESDIILDGGNVVKWKRKAVITNRIVKDNPKMDELGLYEAIKGELGLDQLIVIPEIKGEMTGHSDGIVRFVNANTVVINDFSKIDKEYSRALKFCLLSAGLKYIEIPNELEKVKYDSDDRGDYINFLEMNDFVLIPAFKSKMDEIALSAYRSIFKGKRVDNIDCREIAKEGGALNCISWNIKA
jgi:agmatine deiminase